MWKHVTGVAAGIQVTWSSHRPSHLQPTHQRTKIKQKKNHFLHPTLGSSVILYVESLFPDREEEEESAEGPFKALVITGLVLNYISPSRFKEVKLKSGKSPLYY